MRVRKHSFAVVLSVLQTLVLTVDAFAQCDAVINRGIMTLEVVEQSQESKQDFQSWLCTTEFKTHEEAKDAGIGIGVPVYGVPLKISGTFDSSARDTWKRTHCEGVNSQTESASRLLRLRRYMPKDAFAVWSDCKRQTSYGVVCWFEHDPDDWKNLIFRAKWNPIEGDRGSKPAILGGSVSGAKRTDNLAVPPSLTVPGQKQFDEARSIALTRDPEGGSVSAILNTTRNVCTSAFASAHPPIMQTVYVSSDPVTGRPLHAEFTFDKQDYGTGKPAGDHGVLVAYTYTAPGPISTVEGPIMSTSEYCGWTHHISTTVAGNSLAWQGWTNDAMPCHITFKVNWTLPIEQCSKYCDADDTSTGASPPRPLLDLIKFIEHIKDQN